MKNEFKNKKVTVVGLGRSGLAAVELLQSLGARVKATEIKKDKELEAQAEQLRKNGIPVELGVHSQDFIQGAELIVTSPGVNPQSPPLVWAKEAGLPIIGELELASCFVPGPIIAVTGTNGKTTTATLLGEVLKKSHKVEVAGNIGRPLSSLISNLTPEHLLVLEVSSFQLETIEKFHPYIAIILNITPDHLDRYAHFEEYLLAKKQIFLNQGPEDYAIFPAYTPYTKFLSQFSRSKKILFSLQPGLKEGIFYQDSALWSNFNGQEKKILEEEVIKLKGEHNLENIMATLAVTLILKEDLGEVNEAIKNFSGLEHRLEIFSEINGITLVNDSKSTNVDSLIKAIRSFPSSILIAGGRDKGGDFTPVRQEIEERVKQIILFGEAREKLKKVWENTKPIHLAKDLEEVVELAWKLAKPGDFILFSPGCSSFDMFKNFEERGKVFKEIVSKIKSKIKN